MSAQKAAHFQVFWCFFTGFFESFPGICVSFHNNSKLFLRKKRSLARFCARHNGVNILCAHKFVLFVRRCGKKRGCSLVAPLLISNLTSLRSVLRNQKPRRAHTIAAPSTRCCMASCRMCRALLRMRQCHSALICKATAYDITRK